MTVDLKSTPLEPLALQARVVQFRAHPYSDPDDMLQSVKESWGRDGAPAESTGDYAEQVRRMASQLLLERAHQGSTPRRLGNAA